MNSTFRTLFHVVALLVCGAQFLACPVTASAQEAKSVTARLNSIKLPEVLFDGLPLPEVAKILSTDSKKYDPEKKGVQIDAGGLETVIINLRPVRRNLSLAEVLKAVSSSADRPTGYRVQGEKVVFIAVAKAPVAPPKKK